MLKLIYIALGGATGSLCRYFVGTLTLDYIPNATVFPYGVLAVNVVGSFLIGLSIHNLPENLDLRFLLVTGFLGGFTTFSAFSLDVLTLMRSGQAPLAFVYIAASLLLSFGAVSLGAMVRANV